MIQRFGWWSAWAVACGGGGGGQSPTLVLDEALVNTRIEQAGAAVPGCDTTGGAEMVLRAIAEVAAVRQSPPPEATTLIADGPCGGQAFMGSTHENGSTDYTVAFSAFCTNSADGAVTLDGSVYGRQVGTPSDDGPVISAFEASTPSLVVGQNGQTIEIVVDGARVDYGNAGTWEPAEPDDAHPNRFQVTHAQASFSADGREVVLDDLTMLGTGTYAAPVLEITGGQLGDAGEGFAVLATPPGEPLTLDPLNLRVTSGAVVMNGADDTSLRVDVDDNNPGVFSFTLDGTALPLGLDCSQARGPLVSVGLALLSGLAL